MKEMLANSKDLVFAENNVKILSALTPENEKEIKLLAEELSK